MTAPEWFNVEISGTFGAFLEEDNSMFQFPSLSRIAEMWGVFYQSIQAARKHESTYEIVSSDYMVMDLFVVLMTTTELLLKSLIALPLCFLGTKNETSFQKNLAEYFKFYAKDIEDKPFFLHDWSDAHAQLKQKYDACKTHTWIDWFSWACVSAELKMKRWMSEILKQDFKDEPRTNILVKLRVTGAYNADSAKQQFLSYLDEVNAFRKNNNQLEIILYEIETKNPKKSHNNKESTYVYARLGAPRYMEFRDAIKQLAHKEIHLRKIAGHEHVMVKCDVVSDTNQNLEGTVNQLCQETSQAKLLYSYRDGVNTNRKMCLFDVSVKNIHDTLDALEKKATIPFIHNF